ncbi:hypothetical protein [Streptomyces lonarensis]|uniref:Uncharacterized protein n=1 Tax=Streptomyces lonarensis TaxID=700599 RepID=A0A7X6D110_9ACTN|nr:hypothetical protein [Streptomyces lonarensis]
MVSTTREAASRRREQLLRGVGMSAEELRDRAAAHTLPMDQLMVCHTVEGLTYLLDGPRDVRPE